MNEPLILPLGEVTPTIADDVFIAPNASILGDVTLASGSSIWYGTVLRGDTSPISVGEGSNIQDLCIVHTDEDFPSIIGARVTIGHRVIVHGATIDDDVLIGMGAILLNGAHVGSGSFIAAGALVPPGMDVPPGSLVAGVPGRVVRDVRESEASSIEHGPGGYQVLTATHRRALDAANRASGSA